MLVNADLVEDLARQKVVLFLGAGVSASAATRAGGTMKGWPEFLSASCSNLDPAVAAEVEQLVRDKDYLLACEILQNAHGEAWQDLLTSEYGQTAEPSELHKAIVSLDQRIILTTNFDKLIETAWEVKLGNSNHYPIVISGVKDKAFSSLKDYSRKYLIKIHGSVDDVDTIVFSRSEYVRLAFGNASYSGFLDSILLNYTFLFVGFSMDDPAITSLMEMYALRYPKARPHYIFAPNGRSQRIIDINKKLRKLVTISYDDSNHHALLPGHISTLSKEMVRRRNEIYADMRAASAST